MSNAAAGAGACGSAAVAQTSWKRFFSLDNRVHRARCSSRLHPGGRESFVRHARELQENRRRNRRQPDHGSDSLGASIIGKWPNLASAYISGISVGILVRSPAVWPYLRVRGGVDHVEICAAGERPAHLESVEFWDFGAGVSGAGDGGDLEHSMGQLFAADDRDLDFGSVIIARVKRFHITATYVSCFIAVCVCAELDNRKPVAVGNCAA